MYRAVRIVAITPRCRRGGLWPTGVRVPHRPPDSTSNFFRGGCLAALRLGLVALRKAQSHIIPRLGKRKGSGFVQKLMVRSNFLDKCLNVLKIVALRQFFGFLYI